MLISTNLHKKSSEVSIKTRSPPASFSFKGQPTKRTTVKWSIETKIDIRKLSHENLVWQLINSNNYYVNLRLPNLFRLYILFSQYRSCANTREVRFFSFVD